VLPGRRDETLTGVRHLSSFIGKSGTVVEPRSAGVSKTDWRLLIGQERARFTSWPRLGFSRAQQVFLCERAANTTNEKFLRAEVETLDRIGDNSLARSEAELERR